MGKPAAKLGDEISADDTHTVIVPGPPPVQVQLLHEFRGTINGKLSENVRINGQRAATVGSTARIDGHIPAPPGTSFLAAPSNLGTVTKGSRSVRINGKPAARHGDQAETCNDPAEAPIGVVIANSNVRMG